MPSLPRIALLTALLIVAVAIGALAWLIGTPEGSSRLWSMIESQVPEVRAERVSGSLWHGIEFRNFTLHTPAESFESDRILIAIDFPAMLRGKAVIDRIDLGAVRYRALAEEPEEGEFSVDLGAIPLLNEIALRQLSIQSFVYENTGWSVRSMQGSARLYEGLEEKVWVFESALATGFNIEKTKGRVRMAVDGPVTLLKASARGESNAGDLDLQIQVSNLLTRPEFDLEMTLKGIDSKVLFDQAIARHDFHLTASGNPERARGRLEAFRLAPDPVQPFERLAFLFSADREKLALTDLSASIAKRSVLRGKLAFKYGDWLKPSADLAITGLDLRQIRADLPHSDLEGEVTARPAADHAEIRIRAADRSLGTLNGSIALAEQYAGLDYLRFTSPSGSAEMSGRVAFSGDQAFSLSATTRHLNPGIWIKGFTGDLGFAAEAKGSIEPLTLDARLEFEPGSTLKSEAVRGDLTFNLSRKGLARGTGEVAWGDSRIALQNRGEMLDVRFDRVNPGFFVDGLDTRLSGTSRLTFKPETIRVELDVSTPDIRYRDYTGRNIAAAAQGDTKKLEDFQIRLRIESLEFAPAGARIQGLKLDGTLKSHRLTVAIIRGKARADIALSGTYSAPAYRGTLNRLFVDTAQKKQFSLVQATPFEAGPKKISLGRLALKPLPATPGPEVFEMELALDLVRYRLFTRGRMDHLPLHWLPSGHAPPEGTLSANWNLNYGNALNPLSGRLSAETSKLNIPLSQAPAPPLAFENLSLVLAGRADGLELELRAVQNARNRLQSRVRAAGFPGLRSLIEQELRPQKIHLDGQGSLKLDDLAAFGGIQPDFVVSSGRFNAQARFSGTLHHPLIDGSARLSDLACSVPDQGLNITIPVGEALFDRENLRLTRLDFATPSSGGSGHATASLSLSPEELGNFTFALKGSALQIFDQDTFKLIVSPDLQMSGRPDKLELNGAVRVDRGLFAELSSDRGVSLSPDVVTAKPETGPESAPPDSGARGLYLDIDVDIPKSFRVKAYGADLTLGGRLNVFQAQAGVPAANGRLEVVEDKFVRNTYTAYGQALQIKRGTLLFAQSPVNDPGLDILAVRKVRVGEVGVHVTGTATAPEVELQSEPAMAESEILSWLVLGRPSSEAGQGFGALLLAASGDLTGSQSLVNQTREWLGLDELALGSGEDTTSGVVTLGKRIGEDLYLNYQQGVLEQGYKIKAIYRLTPAWSLIAESARESNVMEIEWSKRF